MLQQGSKLALLKNEWEGQAQRGFYGTWHCTWYVGFDYQVWLRDVWGIAVSFVLVKGW